MNIENPTATITYLLGVLIALQLFILTYLIAKVIERIKSERTTSSTVIDTDALLAELD